MTELIIPDRRRGSYRRSEDQDHCPINQAQAQKMDRSIDALLDNQGVNNTDIALLKQAQRDVMDRLESLEASVKETGKAMHDTSNVLSSTIDSLKSLGDKVVKMESVLSCTVGQIRQFKTQFIIGIIGSVIGATFVVICFSVVLAFVPADIDFLKNVIAGVVGIFR